ncbi:flagellar hook-length control protein FliK [uncultured Methylophaga sp.]|uniref:flagellar hook-length control protein FliK n=1 Tax=uncultured Methylophaga sp. TaxID=285271 RepID=UPI0026200F20|nr:flagellar hook-length control protein FliK [uncultured Methylophaga sp.]
MPQSVIIQTESASPVSSRKAAPANEKAEGGGFSDHFNKQVRQDEAGESQGMATQSKTAEAGKEVAADGKNLPTEKAQSSSSADGDKKASEQPDDQTPATESHDDSKQSDKQKEAMAESKTAEPSIVTSPSTVAAKQQTTTDPGKQIVNQATTTAADKVADKQAALTNNNASAEVSNPAKTIGQQASVKAEAETVKAALTQQGQENKKAVPNLATTLKQLAKEQTDSPKIRADILNALQRHQGKEEISTNLRNLIAAQSQQQDGKAPQILLRPAAAMPILDSSAHAQNGASPLSGLTASAQPMSGQAVASAQSALSLPVQPNMQNPAWGQVMSSRVAWMAKEGIQEAELRMNPARLGPVEVKLHVQNDQASVTFLAQQSATRDALEQALPRLRESFAENGMQLTDAQVGEQEQQQEQSEQSGESQFFAQAQGHADDIDDETVESVSSGGESEGLSLYA